MTLSLDHRNSIISPQWHHSARSCSTVIVFALQPIVCMEARRTMSPISVHTLIQCCYCELTFPHLWWCSCIMGGGGLRGVLCSAQHWRQEATNDQSLSLILSRHVDFMQTPGTSTAPWPSHWQLIHSWLLWFSCLRCEAIALHPREEPEQRNTNSSPTGKIFHSKRLWTKTSTISSNSSPDLLLWCFDWWDPAAPDNHPTPGESYSFIIITLDL